MNFPESCQLTIAIPTYQRNRLLAANLGHLVQQTETHALKGFLRVLILDNASAEPVADSLGSLPPWVEVRRNPHNVGGNGNILRCFEACTTPWLWIIGDDDKPDVDAVAHALRHITEFPTALAIVSAVRNQVCRPIPYTTNGLEDLLQRLDSFANLLFVPSTLYHVAAMRPRFDLGYHYAYCCAPHLVLLFSALGANGGAVVFAKESYIAFERPEVENRGSIIPIAHGLPVLLELPHVTRDARHRLLRHLRRFPSLGSLVHQTLLRQRFGNIGIMTGVRDYCSALRRLSWSAAPLRRCAGFLALPALLVPTLSYPLVAWVFAKLTGQVSGGHKLPLERV